MKLEKYSLTTRNGLNKTFLPLRDLVILFFCALRANQYRINDADPAEAFRLDVEQIKASDALLALVDAKVSTGVQTEVGYALALGKQVILGHDPNVELAWFNKAIVKAGQAKAVTLPISSDPFATK